MPRFTLAGGRVIDPAAGRDGPANVLVEDGRIVHVGAGSLGEQIDVSGAVVAPGLVDVHVHLREPGREDAETIATGTAAAAAGGYTAVFAMPNTDPVADTPERVARLWQLAADSAHCDVYPVGAITTGQRGEQVVDVAGLADAGVRYLSDDGHPVASAALMRQALKAAARAGVVVGNHSEEPTLTVDAQLNEGEVATRLGLVGWPHEAEEVMIARDLLLAGPTGARLHVPHVSTAGSVALVRWARSRGVDITAEATPHHLTLTEQHAVSGDTRFKVNPPLRTQADVDALREAVRDGTIEVIATDHAPHTPDSKSVDWRHAPCGMLGSETALAVVLTELVGPGVLTLSRTIATMSHNPARLMRLEDHGGPLIPGAAANLVVFDPTSEWTVEAARFHSRSRNSPFQGRRLAGEVLHTIVRGAFAVHDGRLTGARVPVAVPPGHPRAGGTGLA